MSHMRVLIIAKSPPYVRHMQESFARVTPEPEFTFATSVRHIAELLDRKAPFHAIVLAEKLMIDSMRITNAEDGTQAIPVIRYKGNPHRHTPIILIGEFKERTEAKAQSLMAEHEGLIIPTDYLSLGYGVTDDRSFDACVEQAFAYNAQNHGLTRVMKKTGITPPSLTQPVLMKTPVEEPVSLERIRAVIQATRPAAQPKTAADQLNS